MVLPDEKFALPTAVVIALLIGVGMWATFPQPPETRINISQLHRQIVVAETASAPVEPEPLGWEYWVPPVAVVPDRLLEEPRKRSVSSEVSPKPSRPPVLLRRAEAYLGTNPTGWSRLWCARFMALIAPDLARRIANPNLARAWARLPRVHKPAPGVIVVLSRGRNPQAGHIGVVKRVEKRAVVVVSGNTIHRGRRAVGINRYPLSRVVAFVDPGNSS
jgi:hypothetical protein